MNKRTLVGHLRQVSTGEYYFECQDGTLEMVVGGAGIPINKLLALCVNQGGLISVEEPSYSLLAEDPAEETNFKRVGIFRIVPYGSSPELHAKWQSMVDDMAKAYQWYWQYHNGKNWIIEVHGYTVEYEGPTGPPYYCRTKIKEFYDAGGCGDFHPNQWMIWGGSGGKCGQATLGGDRGVTYDNPGCGDRTMAHEGGHNYNMHHSGSIEVDGAVSEYGDPTDNMGSSGAFLGFCSPHYLELNLDTGREIKVIDHTQQVFLVPVENLYHSMHDNCWQHGLVQCQGMATLHLSLKKDKGYEFAQRYGGDRLYVHIYENDRKTKLLEPYMSPGVIRVFGRVAIHYVEYDTTMEIARVTVRYDNDTTDIQNLPMPTGLPQNISTVELDGTYNGTWYDARFPGQGLNVCIKNGVLGVAWFTVDANSEPVYLLGGCELKAGVETFTLYKTRGGTFDDPATRVEEAVGVAQVYFYNHGLGVFAYQCKDYGNGSIEITPAGPLTADQRNGMRFDPSKIGSGFAIQYYNDMPTDVGGVVVYQDRISMYWYTYDYRYRQLWFSCEGYKREDSVYTLQIFEILNSKFGYFSDVIFKDVGSATWLPETAVFDYALNSNKVAQTGQLTLTAEAI